MNQHGPDMLPGRDDHRSPIVPGGFDIAHAVAAAGRGVQVHHDGFAGGLRIGVCGRDDHRLLQRQNVFEIGRKILEELFFGGTDITEDLRYSQLTHQVEQHVANFPWANLFRHLTIADGL